MLPGLGKVHTTIRLTVVTVFILATTLTACVAIGLQYYFGQSMARQAANDLYTTASDGIAGEIQSTGAINANVLDLLANNPVLADPFREEEYLEIFRGVMEKNPLFYGVYIGRKDGTFFELINLDASEHARRALRALPSDRWVVVTVAGGLDNNKREFEYFDETMRSRLKRSETADFKVSNRGWFKDAIASEELQRSAPYMFAQLGAPGRTISKRVADSDTVVAIDITLTSMSDFLRSHSLADHGTVYLYSKDGQIIASSKDYEYARPRIPVPALKLSTEEIVYIDSLPELVVSNEMDWPPLDYAQTGVPRGYSIDVMNLIAKMTGLKIRYINGLSWAELLAKFEAGDIDLLHSVIGTEKNRSLGLRGESYMQLPFALATPEGVEPFKDLSQLEGGRVAIPAGWSIIPLVRKRFPDIEIVESESTLQAIEMALSGAVDAALDNEIILRYITTHYFLEGVQFHSAIGLGKGAAPDQLFVLVQQDREMLRSILDKAILAIGDAQREYLTKAWLNFESEPQRYTANVVPSNKLIEIANDPTLANTLIESEENGREYLTYGAPAGISMAHLNVGILTPLDVVVEPFLEKVRLSILITAGFMLLLMPLSWFFANPIVRPVKQIARENDKIRRREYDDVVAVKSYVKELDDLSDSMLEMVKAIQAYEVAQRELMDSFIQLIAQAIDDKSPYTGGHCERVPELALMLARHASSSDDGPFKEFSLDTEEQWREYRIAAWLHDCGKITTPEHVVDKGSKLETIYNRIHEIRMRFEVLWRDAEIEFCKALMQNPEGEPELRTKLEARHRQLQDDFAFIAECNVGGEFLNDEARERLQHLASKTWVRYFDNRIGLSPVEELRLSVDHPALPATENLISDKPEHVIERTRSTDYDPKLGINMDIPEYLYNQGEVYNLSISRGTLTAEDRFKINEHMISTIKMLESLPFPEELKNVPRYASTHHETMRGSGYPRKLPGDQLSIPERILAVADVFEALTASDRPYKKAKPVSVAVDILHKMVLDQHIDQDCFELFIRSRVYEEYAERFLDPQQVDSVDTSKYVAS